MSTLFISYSTKDRAAAEIVYKELVAMGYEKPFRDDHPDSGIPAGADWEQELYRKLKLCKALIVLCSRNWLESKWCFAELAYAKAMGKELFPMLIDDSQDGPAVVPQRQGVKLSDPDVWTRLRCGLAEAGLAPEDDFPWPVDGVDECPYPGLASFESYHAGVYFGRDQELLELRERLNQMVARGAPRLLYVVGASGSGKSSLVKAGLLPRLTRKEATAWCVLPTFRFNELRAKGRNWSEQLAIDIQGAWPDSSGEKPDWKSLRQRYSQSAEESAAHFIDDTKGLLVARGQPDATPLLVIDQFEEILLATDDATAKPLLQFLGCVLSSARSPWRSIGTVRSDSLAAIQSRGELIPWQVHTGFYWLSLMKPERFYDVIRRPAEKVGMTFESDALVDRMVKDTGTNDALPLLAFALRELYKQPRPSSQLSFDDYTRVGGLEGCMAKVADELLGQRSGADRSSDQQRERLLHLVFSNYLVRLDDKDQFLRSTVLWTELPPEAHVLLQPFIDRRLITSRPRDEANPHSNRVVEVAHEALLRNWDTLERWLNERRDLLRWRRDVERDRQLAGNHWSGLTRAQLAIARDWPRERGKELSATEYRFIKSAQRRVQLIRTAMVAVGCLILTFAGVAIYQASIAKTNFKLAAGQRAISLRMIRDTLYATLDELEQSPRTVPVRRRIVGIIDKGLQDLRDTRLSGDEVTHLESVSQIAMAKLILESEESPTDRLAEAQSLLERSLGRLAEIVERSPTNSEYLRDSSWASNVLGELCLRQGSAQTALEHFKRSMDLIGRAAAINPKRFAPDAMWSCLKMGDYYQAFALSSNAEADVELRRKTHLQTIEWYERAESIAKEGRGEPGSKMDNALAATLDRLCDGYLGAGLIEKGKDAADRVLRLRQKILVDAPLDQDSRRFLAHAYIKQGNVHLEMNQPAEAVKHYTESVERRKLLLSEDPGNPDLEYDLAHSYYCLAEAKIKLNDSEEALSAIRQQLQLIAKQLKSTPDARGHGQLLSGHTLAGEFLLNSDRVDEAETHFKQALSALLTFDQDRTPPLFTAEIEHLRGRLAECERRLSGRAKTR